MIKFYGDNILKNSKLIDLVADKGDNIYEALHFDLENNYIFVLNKSIILRMKFDFELLGEGDLPSNFYISAGKFLHLLNKYPILDINLENKSDEIETTSDGVKVGNCISIVTEKNEVLKLGFEFSSDIKTFNESFNITDYDNIEFNINDNFNSMIKNALVYMTKKENDSFHGVFIKNNYVISSNKTGFFYEKKYEDQDIPDLNLTPEMVKIIGSLKFNNLKILKNDQYLVISDQDENISIKVANNKELSLDIDTQSESFRSQYNFKTSFEIQTEKFQECLSFFDFFVTECPDNRINITIKEDKLLIKVIDNNYVEKDVEIISTSPELIGYDFWVSQDVVKTIAKDFKKSETLVFQIEPVTSDNSPAINVKAKDNDSDHIVFVKNCETI